MTALEVLIDEAAAALPLDPIEFRRRNALKTGGKNMTGNPYIVSIRTPEILDKLEKHPIWQKKRAQEKARGQQGGIVVGTGVACVTKDTAPERIARSRRWKSTLLAGSPSTAIMSIGGNGNRHGSGHRGWQPIWWRGR